jgi:hypothetical protein
LHRIGCSILLLALACEGASSDEGDGDSEGIGTLGPNTTNTTGSDDLDESGTMTVSMGSGETGPPICGESQFMLEVIPTRVMLVLDKSRSMVINTWDHDTDAGTEEVTRWASLHGTVDLVTIAFDGSIEFGALLYPSLEATTEYNENACIVSETPEVPPAAMNHMAIMDALPAADADEEIQGGTPSATAVSVALAELLMVQEDIPRAILFITDGEANCRADAEVVTELFEDYDQSLHTVVEDAWTMDEVPTYVVGIAIRDEVLPEEVDGAPDGINPHEQLNLLAEQGGRPRDGDVRYYATDNQVELEAALAEIVGQEFDCSVGLSPVPEHPQFVEIEVGGMDVAHVEDCATEDGWVFTNPDGPYDSIELCGAACDLLAAEGTLQAIYACPPPE